MQFFLSLFNDLTNHSLTWSVRQCEYWLIIGTLFFNVNVTSLAILFSFYFHIKVLTHFWMPSRNFLVEIFLMSRLWSWSMNWSTSTNFTWIHWTNRQVSGHWLGQGKSRVLCNTIKYDDRIQYVRPNQVWWNIELQEQINFHSCPSWTLSRYRTRSWFHSFLPEWDLYLKRKAMIQRAWI